MFHITKDSAPELSSNRGEHAALVGYSEVVLDSFHALQLAANTHNGPGVIATNYSIARQDAAQPATVHHLSDHPRFTATASAESTDQADSAPLATVHHLSSRITPETVEVDMPTAPPAQTDAAVAA